MEYAHVCIWPGGGKDEEETGETWIKVSAKEAVIISDALGEHHKKYPRRKTIDKLWDQWTMSLPYFT